MIFKTIEIKSDRPIDIDTEIKFFVATARAEEAELMRFDIKRDEESYTRVYNAAVKVLKKMKALSHIQFIATPKEFLNSNAEAEFLINKYPEQMENIPKCGDGEGYIFVKL